MTTTVASITSAPTEGENLISGMATAQTRQRKLLKRLDRAKRRVAAPILKRAGYCPDHPRVLDESFHQSRLAATQPGNHTHPTGGPSRWE